MCWRRLGQRRELGGRSGAGVPLNRLDDLVAASALLGARLNTRLEDLGEALGHRQRLTAADKSSSIVSRSPPGAQPSDA